MSKAKKRTQAATSPANSRAALPEIESEEGVEPQDEDDEADAKTADKDEDEDEDEDTDSNADGEGNKDTGGALRDPSGATSDSDTDVAKVPPKGDKGKTASKVRLDSS
jgi:hypothetical protein